MVDLKKMDKGWRTTIGVNISGVERKITGAQKTL